MTTSGPNWARRYGPNHRRLCARPGCGAPAAATLRFQPTQREAWLVELEDDAARTEGDLCARHAAGLVLPRGWQLHNSLTSAAGNAGEPKPVPPVRRARGASIARARRRRSATSAVELPGLAPVPDAVVAEVVVAEVVVDEVVADEVVVDEVVAEVVVDEVAAEPVVDVVVEAPKPEIAPLVPDATPEVSEELAETLDAQTPLLRRAFSNIFPPDRTSDS